MCVHKLKMSTTIKYAYFCLTLKLLRLELGGYRTKRLVKKYNSSAGPDDKVPCFPYKVRFYKIDVSE